MDFVNHTPFPALAFEGIDQHDQAFHVLVLRQTLTFANGCLEYADTQEPLCEQDAYFGAMGQSSLRQESDLCQYKPKCDVIVNGQAHAPQGKPGKRWAVRLRVMQPDTVGAAAPERPQGLNPFMAPSQKELQAWRLQSQHAQSAVTPGACLIDKTLNVTGPRQFKKLIWPLPWITTAVQWCSLGLIRISPWRLTASKAITQVPLIAENAYGGQCRINAGDKAAHRIPKKQRLTAAQQAGHPSAEQPAPERAVAHSACEANPIGCGFAQRWYTAAAKISEVKAPQIEHPGRPITLGGFKLAQRGKHTPKQTSQLAASVAGLGVRAKGHPERRKLGGTFDEAFIKGSAALPPDFDFAVWNAAWPDQQCACLQNDETLELTNLCAPGLPGTATDSQGNTVLRLDLLGHQATVLMRMYNGTMFFHPLKIDTLIIEPDSQTVSVVWRAVVAKDTNIRAMNLRLHTEFERDFSQMMFKAAQEQQPLAAHFKQPHKEALT